MKILLNSGAEINAQVINNSMFLYSMLGNTEMMKILLKFGADINAQDPYTPLHLSAMIGHTNMTKILIDAGTNVNVRDTSVEKKGSGSGCTWPTGQGGEVRCTDVGTREYGS